MACTAVRDLPFHISFIECYTILIGFYKTSIVPYNSVIASYKAFKEPYKARIGIYHLVIALYTALRASDKPGVWGRKDIYNITSPQEKRILSG
jgi:hypothetical protein